MEIEQDGDKIIVLNTPVGLDVELLFGELPIKFIPKAKFLIHQINYFDMNGGYQVNTKNHRWFFGIKGTELTTLLSRLVNCGIIKLATNYSPGCRSNTYQMVQPFDIATSIKSFFRVDDITFLQKWVADKYIVKNAATSKFAKKPNVTKTTIASQQKEINELKALLVETLRGLNLALPTLLLPVVDSVPGSETEGNASTNITVSEKQPDSQLQPFSVTVATDLPANEEELAIQLPLTEAHASTDITVEKDVPNGELAVIEIAVSTDLLAGGDDDLNQLLSVFDGGNLPDAKEDLSTLPIEENFSTTVLSDIIEEEPVEQTNDVTQVPEGGLQESEVFSDVNIKTELFEDMLCIMYNDSLACIENYEEISLWCSQMSENEKQQLYLNLMSTKGKTVKFKLNSHTSAIFERDESDDRGIIFRYQMMTAA